jgi:hypothetical protein
MRFSRTPAPARAAHNEGTRLAAADTANGTPGAHDTKLSDAAFNADRDTPEGPRLRGYRQETNRKNR